MNRDRIKKSLVLGEIVGVVLGIQGAIAGWETQAILGICGAYICGWVYNRIPEGS